MAMSTKDHKIELAKASAAVIMQQNVYRLRLLPILQRAGSTGVDAATMVQLIESWLGELLETLAKSSGVNRLRPVDVFRNIPDIRMENRPAGWYWVLASFPMKQSADVDSPKGSHPWDASIERAGSDRSVDGSTAEFTRMTSGLDQKSRVYPGCTTTVKDKNERLKLAARSAAAFVLKTNVYQKELIPMLEEAGDSGVDGATMVAFVERELGAMLGHHAKLGKVTKLRAVDVFRHISDIRMEKRLDGWHWILAAPGEASQIDDDYNNINNNYSAGITTATATAAMNESFQYNRAILAGHNGEMGNQVSGAAVGAAEAGQNKGFGSFFNTEGGHYYEDKEQQKLAARSAAAFVLKTNVYQKQLIPMLEEAGENGLDGAKMVAFVERELGAMLAHHARLGRVPRLTAVEVFRNIPQIQMQRRGKAWYWVLASVPSGAADSSYSATSSSLSSSAAAKADGYNAKVTATATASAPVSVKNGNYPTNAANIDSRELLQEEYVCEQQRQQPQLEQQQQREWMTKQQIAAAAAAGAVVKCHVFRKTIIPMLQEAGSIGVEASKMTEIVKRELTPLLKYHARENDVQWLTPVEVFQEIPHISFVKQAGVRYWLLTSALSDATPAECQEQQQLQQEHHKEQLQSEYVKCSDNEPTTESSTSSIASSITSTPLLSDIELIDTLDKLETTMHQWPYNSSAANPHPGELPVVAVDCEGVPERLLLVQIATADATHVFDCTALGASTVCSLIGELLANRGVVKLFHDLHNDAFAFSRHGSFSEPMRSCFDTQLAMESLTNNMFTGFHSMLAYLDMPALQSIKNQVQHQMKSKSNGSALLMKRPMDPETLAWVVDDVRLLQRAFLPLVSRLQVGADAIICASDERARVARSTAEHARQMCFDKANDCAMASPELLSLLRPKDVLALGPPRSLDESETLMSLLPFDIALELLNKTHQLCDIALDKGRRAHALIGDQRVMLGAANRLVTAEEITKVTDGLGVGQDKNRVCIEQQLHRISVLRNRINEPIGLTIRVGRHVEGNSAMISDLLFSDRSKSILILGEPGSGKTTLLRDIAKQLAEQDNVWIIDTSNEIAGDGDVPHSCVGNARRLMVNSPEEQERVMIECVQNHTPAVMVIDEIGHPAEAEAARTCKQRGIRLIASVAHGDLRKLAKNANLMDLVGAIESTTGSFPGDDFCKGMMMMGMEMEGATATAAVASSNSKSKVSRAARAAPVFDLIVELSRGKLHEWRVVLDVSQAVDQVMEGKPYRAQLRCRDADTGSLSMKHD